MTPEEQVELVDFTLDGRDGPALRVLEVNRIKDDLISRITPFYFDPAPWLAAGDRKKAATETDGGSHQA